MFSRLTNQTYEIIDWACYILETIETIYHVLDDNNAGEVQRKIMASFEEQPCSDEVWSFLAKTFPDLIDELNEVKLRLYNEEHPDDT